MDLVQEHSLKQFPISRSLDCVLMARQVVDGVQNVFFNNGFTDVEFYTDSVLNPGYTIEGSEHAYAELQKCFSSLWDINSSSSLKREKEYIADAVTNATTTVRRFTPSCLLGSNYKRYQDDSIVLSGINVNQSVDIKQNGNTSTDPGTAYIFLCKTRELIVLANGEVLVN